MATMEHDTTRRAVEDHPELGARELRLALVCYGGVSLAISMHGITKEIHKRVLASAAFNGSPTTDPAVNPFPANDTQSVYWDVLRRMYTGELGRRRASAPG